MEVEDACHYELLLKMKYWGWARSERIDE